MKHDLSKAKKYGMVIDLDKCTGCGACMVACMSENNVPFKADETNKLDSITWMRVFKLTNGEPYPNADSCFLPRPCMHCEGEHSGHSPCVSVCPATATDYSSETGIVSQIYTPLLWMPVLHGGLPLPCAVFQLVGSGLARGDGNLPEPRCEPAHARGGGKVQFLFFTGISGP